MEHDTSSPGGSAASRPAGLLGGLKQRAVELTGAALSRGVMAVAEQTTRAISRSPEAQRTFFDPSEFPFTARMEREYPVIREELDALMRGVDLLPNLQDIQHEQGEVTTDDKWKMFIFYGYGLKSESNCRRCPRTTRLLESIPGMQSAMFSILRGRKHIPPHTGHYKGVLRYHLGLIVPEPEKCRIRVGQETVHWQEGRSLLFDDTHEHEVWKESEGDRVILLVDLLRPLPLHLDFLNRMVTRSIRMSPYIRHGERNLQRWEEYFGQDFDLRRPPPAGPTP